MRRVARPEKEVEHAGPEEEGGRGHATDSRTVGGHLTGCVLTLSKKGSSMLSHAPIKSKQQSSWQIEATEMDQIYAEFNRSSPIMRVTEA
jgi:hypothetical protein